MQAGEERIAQIVAEVLKKLQPYLLPGQPAPDHLVAGAAPANTPGEQGIFNDLEAALAAAKKAQAELMALARDTREKIIAAIRQIFLENAEKLARLAVEETAMGRYEDKIVKNKNAALLTPGMEDLEQRVDAGTTGMIFSERGPFGLIVSIEPTTNPVASPVNHGLAMIAAGNSVFFAPHPRAVKCCHEVVRLFNEAICKAGGPANLVVTTQEVSLDNVRRAMASPQVNLIVATGGHTLVEAALASGKKCIAGGPGNPPVVVDETADIELAARNIILGASFDNNLLCIAEKEVFVVDQVADALLLAMQRQGNYVASNLEIQQLTKLLVVDGKINSRFIGQNPSRILKEIGVRVGDEVRAVVMEVPLEHPLVTLEQLMPVLPVVRVKDFATALKVSREVEHGFRHTAAIYTRDYTRAAAFARAMEATLTVVNVPTYAGLGGEGIGKPTMTVAGPTGEGITSPRTYTRERNVVFGGQLTIV
ncbi:Aldehyde/histidinol dehydrogenase [Moorella glycerini]|uniref:Aldehyde-alcohol dehydrogenase n=1 Tax=Neomoorella stamsii TaxID=1266720 RepID=A0A9X7P652_9FIRM|nr:MULTISPECIES: aldehyde dehydrogenase [Moorella]PRR72609.1 Aldehyde-alcohol dehydrogenase [Moorella stamsii]CEP67765.1 Aldehyde/histidinol dehydrogenase [Moorella glycerini]